MQMYFANDIYWLVKEMLLCKVAAMQINVHMHICCSKGEQEIQENTKWDYWYTDAMYKWFWDLRF